MKDGDVMLPVQRLTAMRAALISLCADRRRMRRPGQRLAAPKVEVVGVRLDRVQDARAYFGGDRQLARPESARAINAPGFDAALAVEGEVVATATLVALGARPGERHGPSRAGGADRRRRAGARGDRAAMRRRDATPGHGPSLQYAIGGTAVFNGRLRVPFVRRGELGRGLAPGTPQ